MNLIFLRFILLISVVLFTGRAQAAENRYEAKSGIIQYKISGLTTGEETLYFDNWGQQEARYTNQTVTVMGSTQDTQSIRLIDGDFAYVVDQEANTATQFDRTALMKQMMGDNSQRIDYNLEMIQAMGGVKIGTGIVLGKACNIWQIKNAGTKVWEWNKIALKSETKLMGINITVSATTLDIDAEIDQAKLALPEGVEIIEGETQLAEMETPETEEAVQKAKQKSTIGNTVVNSAVNAAKDTAQNQVNNTARQKVNGLFNRFIK